MAYDWTTLPSKHPKKKFPKVGKLPRLIPTQPNHRNPHELPEEKKPEKYHNKPTQVDGIKFRSGKEARRYQELVMAEKAGLISNLEAHPRFHIDLDAWVMPDGGFIERAHICDYIADFSYTETESGRLVIEDTKGKDKKTRWDTRTEAYKLKKIMMRVIKGIEVREI